MKLGTLITDSITWLERRFDLGCVGVDGFLLRSFGESLEFKDEFEPDLLHGDVVFVRDAAESSLYASESAAVSQYPSSVSMYHAYLEPNM